jgi:hypothetical protein
MGAFRQDKGTAEDRSFPAAPDIRPNLWRRLPPDIQREARSHWETLALLRVRVVSARRQKVVRQIGQDFKGSRQSFSLFAKHDFVTSAEKFPLLARFGTGTACPK